MGEEALVNKPELSFFMIQESGARCTSELGRERFNLRALFQAGSDESLNQGDISLLQRINRLDYILLAMEDKAPLEPSSNSFRSLNGSRRISPSALERRCKSMECVLEEVEEKGTLIERISELETRLTKLEEMIIKKPKDNVALHSIPSYDQTSHNNEHEESLQDDVDVEKHEVTPVSSAHLELSEYEQHHEPPSTYSEKFETSPRKEESSKHMEGQQGIASSEGVTMEKEDPRTRLQKAKKKNQIRKWLSKRLHMGSSTRQGKPTCSTGHCWSSHKNPQSCWHTKRGELHASSDYAHHAHHSIEEDSP